MDTIPQKRCSRCKQFKPLTSEFFPSDKSRKHNNGLNHICKECKYSHRYDRPPTTETQRCIHCKEEKPLTCFFIARRRKSGYQSSCKECNKARDKFRKDNPRPIVQQPLFPTTKICNKCKVDLPVERFYDRPGTRDGKEYYCASCMSAKQKYYAPRYVERQKGYREKYAKGHSELIKQKHIKRYAREEVREKYAKNGRAYYERNKEKIIAKGRQRALKMQFSVDGNVSYERILERDGMWCYLCEGPIHSVREIDFDHVIPLTPLKSTDREPGIHSENNLKPTHSTCNRRKHNFLLEELPLFKRRGPEYVVEMRNNGELPPISQ